ncbi:hypothetical protein JTB14_024582 [Gonioctena quinquepunctata]|nr:hypothetical protein JTB14_024582 [Gonioctena quinquepunctata]
MRFPLHTNCMGSYRYDEGEIVKEDEKENCIILLRETLRVLGDTSGIDTEIIDYLPPRESSTDSSSWDWLTAQRFREREFEENNGDGLPSTNILGSFRFMPSWKDPMLLFLFHHVLVCTHKHCGRWIKEFVMKKCRCFLFVLLNYK